MITNQVELRRQFWADHPDLDRTKIKMGDERIYKTDTRVAWVDYVDHMQKSGQIPEKLAQRAVLEVSRTRKTTDEFDIEQDAGQGWEVVCCELNRKAARDRIKDYRRNQPEFPVRIKPHRVKIETKQEGK